MTLNTILSHGQREAFEECVRVLEDAEKWLDGHPRRLECTAETQTELLGSIRAALRDAKPFVRPKT